MSLQPQITSVLPGSEVHARLLLVEGVVSLSLSPTPELPLDGLLLITPHPALAMPPLRVSFRANRFKALLPLYPGPNDVELLVLHLDRSPHPNSPPAPPPSFRTFFHVVYAPQPAVPPLKLAIVLGSDSTGAFDDVPPDAAGPGEWRRHPNDLETACRRLRMAGYMWAAYTQDEMQKGGFGFRTFRLDEAMLPDSLSQSDVANGRQVVRQTAVIHVLRSRKYTVAEIRDPNLAQQVQGAKKAGSLFDIAIETIQENGLGGGEGGTQYVAALFADAHARQPDGAIVGHAALGGGTGNLQLAIFGSHTLFSWPTHLEELEGCLTDARPVDRRFCGVDAEGSRYFAAANVGIGAMMHEVGHLFGCPHQASGVMLRDYPRLHRSFTVLDPPDADAVVGRGVCHWHRLDLLRFAGHPSFALPAVDGPHPVPAGGVSCLGTAEGVQLRCPAGVRVVEIHVEGSGHEFPSAWLEIDTPAPVVVVPEAALRERVGSGGGGGRRLRLNVIGRNGSSCTVDDVSALLAHETVPGVGPVWRSALAGLQTEGGTRQTLILPPALRAVQVRGGSALDAIEFFPLDGPAPLRFGGTGGGPCGGGEFALAPGEHIVGFRVRSGLWMDAVEVVLNSGRSTGMLGNAGGGGPSEFLCPEGYRVCGVYGDVGSWVLRFGMLYTRAA
ncbi:putative peptidase family-domain-containing protein [Zopfochytrium polystomum]|nr:putative peptidase family-domain-containing protein [Zopfochytrium polystomum]